MYVDREKALRAEFAPLQVDIERGRLRLFAKAIGETRPIYTEVDAARQAGYRDLPVPPSFLGNSIELDIPDPLGWAAALGIDTSSTLHAEQLFVYHRMAFAGDSLVLRRKIIDVYLKKGGALEFVVKQTDIMRGEELLAQTWFVMAVRHPEAAAAPRPVPADQPEVLAQAVAAAMAASTAASAPLGSASQVAVGMSLPPLQIEPISRKTLALFAGGSGDHQAVHIDLDTARSRGRDDVFAHGMLAMAHLGRLLTNWAAPERIRAYKARFVTITPVYAQPSCSGRVTAIENGLATLDLSVTLADGTTTVRGEAVVALA